MKKKKAVERRDSQPRFNRSSHKKSQGPILKSGKKKKNSRKNNYSIKFNYPTEKHNCAFCGKQLEEFRTVVYPVALQNKPTHFDCAIDMIKKEEKLAANEKITYLGSGSFGIVSPAVSSPKYVIRKTIAMEDKDLKTEMRKVISANI